MLYMINTIIILPPKLESIQYNAALDITAPTRGSSIGREFIKNPYNNVGNLENFAIFSG